MRIKSWLRDPGSYLLVWMIIFVVAAVPLATIVFKYYASVRRTDLRSMQCWTSNQELRLEAEFRTILRARDVARVGPFSRESPTAFHSLSMEFHDRHGGSDRVNVDADLFARIMARSTHGPQADNDGDEIAHLSAWLQATTGWDDPRDLRAHSLAIIGWRKYYNLDFPHHWEKEESWGRNNARLSYHGNNLLLTLLIGGWIVIFAMGTGFILRCRRRVADISDFPILPFPPSSPATAAPSRSS